MASAIRCVGYPQENTEVLFLFKRLAFAGLFLLVKIRFEQFARKERSLYYEWYS